MACGKEISDAEEWHFDYNSRAQNSVTTYLYKIRKLAETAVGHVITSVLPVP